MENVNSENKQDMNEIMNDLIIYKTIITVNISNINVSMDLYSENRLIKIASKSFDFEEINKLISNLKDFLRLPINYDDNWLISRRVKLTGNEIQLIITNKYNVIYISINDITFEIDAVKELCEILCHFMNLYNLLHK